MNLLSLVFLFAEPVSYAENELLLPSAVRVPGRVRGARHPPGPALASPPRPSVHHPVGRSADQGLPPRPLHLHLPRMPPVDEELQGPPELGRPLLPLPGVHHPPLGAGAVDHGGALGVALMGTGERQGFCCADVANCISVHFVCSGCRDTSFNLKQKMIYS